MTSTERRVVGVKLLRKANAEAALEHVLTFRAGDDRLPQVAEALKNSEAAQ